MSAKRGFLYIVHLTPKYKHARHYIGFTFDLKKRIATHRAGNGARLLEVAAKAGCRFKFAVISRGTRDDERRLKNEAHSARHCPFCA